jgi:hypothetical protein
MPLWPVFWPRFRLSCGKRRAVAVIAAGKQPQLLLPLLGPGRNRLALCGAQPAKMRENLVVLRVSARLHEARITGQPSGSFRPQVQDDRTLLGHGGRADAFRRCLLAAGRRALPGEPSGCALPVADHEEPIYCRRNGQQYKRPQWPEWPECSECPDGCSGISMPPAEGSIESTRRILVSS